MRGTLLADVRPWTVAVLSWGLIQDWGDAVFHDMPLGLVVLVPELYILIWLSYEGGGYTE